MPPVNPFEAFERYAPFTNVEALTAASQRPLRKSVRVNLLKMTVPQLAAHAKEKNWQLAAVPWCPEGFFVDREDREQPLGKDLLHLVGHFYMQEASSMLPAALLDPQPGEAVLDMSAAPGSKTTQIGSRMEGRGVIVANDMQEKRLWTLKASLQRSGVWNVIVTKKVGQWFARHMTERFDRVLCDAPCTAQGTVRKDTDALRYASVENSQKMALLQHELLESAVHAAKVGGCIVYSTCTLTPEENEQVASDILNKFSDQLEVVDPRSAAEGSDVWGLEKAVEDSQRVQKHLGFEQQHPFVRIWPQTYDTEGFFCAVLRKCAPTRDVMHVDKVYFQEEELPRKRVQEVADALAQTYGTSFLREGERLFARGEHLLLSTSEVASFMLPVQDYSLGLPFAKFIKRDGRVIPEHELATLRGMEATQNTIELNPEQASQILTGLDSTTDTPLAGHVLLRVGDLCVGRALAVRGKLKNNLPRWMVQLG